LACRRDDECEEKQCKDKDEEEEDAESSCGGDNPECDSTTPELSGLNDSLTLGNTAKLKKRGRKTKEVKRKRRKDRETSFDFSDDSGVDDDDGEGFVHRSAVSSAAYKQKESKSGIFFSRQFLFS
jgi:hypothetical protein